jgi:hypothetical protein
MTARASTAIKLQAPVYAGGALLCPRHGATADGAPSRWLLVRRLVRLKDIDRPSKAGVSWLVGEWSGWEWLQAQSNARTCQIQSEVRK